MTMGAAIALIAIGLILAFAVNFSIAGIDVHLIGFILAGVGVLGLILHFVVLMPRRRSSTTVREGYADPRGGYVEERRTYDDPL